MTDVINEKEVEHKQMINPKKLIIKKRHDINISDDSSSDLGKRKLCDSFGEQIYNDKERYGQDIPADFFNNNTGHNVYEVTQDPLIDESEILDWCYKYLASKKK